VTRRLFLVDACVLLDYANTSRDLLSKVSDRVGKLHVTPTIFQEVRQVRPEDARSLGLSVVEPTLEMLGEAATGNSRLSFADRLAVVVSRAHGFTCVSNDRQVAIECQQQGVPAIRGLELLVRLVDANGITRTQAKLLGTKMCASNRWLGPKVLKLFFARLEK
jgi:hypothetical protein